MKPHELKQLTKLFREKYEVVYSRAVYDEILSSPGVYIFFSSDFRCLYVGKSVNLKNRIVNSAIRNIAKEKGDIYITAYSCSCEEDAIALESLVIQILTPVLNKKKIWYCSCDLKTYHIENFPSIIMQKVLFLKFKTN